MNIVVFGAGEMGKAICTYFLKFQKIESLTLIDINSSQLKRASENLSRYVCIDKLILNNSDNIEEIISSCNIVFAAVPWQAHAEIINLVCQYDKPMLSVTRPNYSEISKLENQLQKMVNPVVVGCGLEPGLTEIMALYCANLFDHLDELHIKCGGITRIPSDNIFKHKTLFGTRYLPISMRDAYTIKNKKKIKIARFSDAEEIDILNLGKLEAWHDGMVPWLYKYPEIASAHTVTQKTLRWPGFSETVNQLDRLGLLSEEQIQIGEIALSPKQFLEYFYEHDVKLNNDNNVSLLKIIATGKHKKNNMKKVFLSLIATNRTDMGLNSMAFITGFSVSLIGVMLLQGKINEHGFVRPEKIICGEPCNFLMESLKSFGIEISINTGIYSDKS